MWRFLTDPRAPMFLVYDAALWAAPPPNLPDLGRLRLRWRPLPSGLAVSVVLEIVAARESHEITFRQRETTGRESIRTFRWDVREGGTRVDIAFQLSRSRWDLSLAEPQVMAHISWLAERLPAAVEGTLRLPIRAEALFRDPAEDAPKGSLEVSIRAPRSLIWELVDDPSSVWIPPRTGYTWRHHDEHGEWAFHLLEKESGYLCFPSRIIRHSPDRTTHLTLSLTVDYELVSGADAWVLRSNYRPTLKTGADWPKMWARCVPPKARGCSRSAASRSPATPPRSERRPASGRAIPYPQGVHGHPGQPTGESRSRAQPTTRAALIELAADLFAERGYLQTSIRDIARRGALTSGAIYANFRNKADLLAEAIAARTARELEDRSLLPEPEGSHLQTLRRLSEDFQSRRRLRALIIQGAAAAQTDPETRDRMREDQQAQLDRWIAGYEQHRDALGLDPSLDVPTAVLYTWAAEVGLGVLEAFGIQPGSAAAWADMAARVGAAMTLPPQPADARSGLRERRSRRSAR